MKNIVQALREARKKQSLSQQKLANMAGLSLATIQNIEAGKGNPELTTIDSILKVLSLEVELKPRQIDIESLAALGLPLMTPQRANTQNKPNAEALILQLTMLANDLKNISIRSREAMAVASFLCAINDHYPSVWHQLHKKLKQWFNDYPEDISPKLRRISLRNLGDYL